MMKTTRSKNIQILSIWVLNSDIHSTPLTSLYMYFITVYCDLASVISFSRRGTLMLIENVVTHIFQFVSQSLYSAEYTIGSRQCMFTRGRFCLQAYVFPSRWLCQVVPFSFDSSCYEHLTSILKYVLDQYCR